jgi:vacuolar iron transporter family protein
MSSGLSAAASFAVGAGIPLLVTTLLPAATLLIAVPVTSLLVLALLGVLTGRAGGAPMTPGAIRVTFCCALAMVTTAGVGPCLEQSYERTKQGRP